MSASFIVQIITLLALCFKLDFKKTARLFSLKAALLCELTWDWFAAVESRTRAFVISKAVFCNI